MYARSTTVRGNPSAVEDCVAYMRDEVLPAVSQMEGCVGLSMLANRDTGGCIITSAWADEQAMRATADRVRPMRDRVSEMLGAEAEVREWEIAVLHRAHPANPGAWARVTWTRVDPAQAERLLDAYRMTLMPRLEELPGFCSLSLLVDRREGRAVGAVSFETREAVEATRGQTKSLRENFAQQVSAEITDVAEMELVLAHLRVPETV